MKIISKPSIVVTETFGALVEGDVFQRKGSRKLYLKSAHSSGKGGNAVRLSSGLRSTLKDTEEVVVRDDAAICFDGLEG